MTGVNIPQPQLLSVIDFTTGKFLINQDPTANGGVLILPAAFTQASNSTVTVSTSFTALGTSDKLQIFYDDGQPTPSPSSGTPVLTNHTATTSSAQVFAANAARKGFVITNEGASTAYILLGAGTASITNYTWQVASGGSLNVAGVSNALQSITSTSTAVCRVTELF